MNFKKIYCDTDWLNIWKLKRIYLKSNKELNDKFKCLYISFNPSLYTLFHALFTLLLPNCECEMSVLDLSNRMLHVHQFLTTHQLKNAENLVSNLYIFL